MNAYPYTSGHLMVAPLRHEGTLSGLSTDEANALMAMTQDATVAVDARLPSRRRQRRCEHRPRRPAPASPATCTSTCVPRWNGDTNFMTTRRRRAGAPGAAAPELGEAAKATGPTRSADVAPQYRARREPRRDATRGSVLPEDLDVTVYVGPVPVPGHPPSACRGQRCLPSLHSCCSARPGWPLSGNDGLWIAALILFLDVRRRASRVNAWHLARWTRPRR